MTARFILIILSLGSFIASCTKEYDCEDLQVQPAFINYPLSDIDTFVLRKFKAGDNYQTLIDTTVAGYGSYTAYHTSNDTTTVFVIGTGKGIRAGFDWQLYIPAKNRTILISDIASEHKTGKRNHGIFSLDPGPSCTNDIFSLKVNNQLINFSNPRLTGYYIYLTN